ncbi:hypothetical protein TD95_004726 [Thielaviopsis punctulata]|uniref:Uncharacterized protein n=1 Tax=Thielaviopsis punctulata TaxID=72032 RepID=A0A0F4ZEN8_9PEZI|nr:hypothetical protein TD95_004726 [Thielaviopsis punctulata]
MATSTMDWDMETDDVAPVDNVVQDAFPTTQFDDNEASGSNLPDLELESTIAPTKIHVRGLDTLTTKDIRNYVREHYGEVDRVEWIDDTSANLLFSSELIAGDAMNSLSATSVDFSVNPSPDLLFDAKPVSGKPEISLKIRPAFLSDKKEAGAAARSRFYLLNPECDPEERARRRENRDRQSSHHDGRKPRRSDRRRYDDDDIEKYNDTFYDDGVFDSPRHRHRERSYSRSRSRSATRNRNHGKELFPDRSATSRTSARGRSASPIRDLNDDMDADMETGRPERNKDRELFIKHQQAMNNRAKELFPNKKASSGNEAQLDKLDKESRLSYLGLSIKGAASKPQPKELFPSKFSQNSGKELFSEKLEGRGKPRQKAVDHW